MKLGSLVFYGDNKVTRSVSHSDGIYTVRFADIIDGKEFVVDTFNDCYICARFLEDELQLNIKDAMEIRELLRRMY